MALRRILVANRGEIALRIVRAAQYWLAGHAHYAGHDIAFDVVLAAPWRWPQHIANAFPV